MPREFARQPRSLFDVERWKATEFRQFLLYTGPMILRKVLTRDMYEHFLSFSVAISILLESREEKRIEYLRFARDLLQHFVNKSVDLYTDIFVVFNVHNPLHLADDVTNLNSSLNEISAFPFENYLRTIKKMVRNAANPICQVSKRLSEAEQAQSRVGSWFPAKNFTGKSFVYHTRMAGYYYHCFMK